MCLIEYSLASLASATLGWGYRQAARKGTASTLLTLGVQPLKVGLSYWEAVEHVWCFLPLIKREKEAGLVAQGCNPSTGESETELKASLDLTMSFSLLWGTECELSQKQTKPHIQIDA